MLLYAHCYTLIIGLRTELQTDRQTDGRTVRHAYCRSVFVRHKNNKQTQSERRVLSSGERSDEQQSVNKTDKVSLSGDQSTDRCTGIL